MKDALNIPPPTPAEWLRARRKMHADEPWRSSRMKMAQHYQGMRSANPKAARAMWRFLKRAKTIIAEDMLAMAQSRQPSFADLIAPLEKGNE